MRPNVYENKEEGIKCVYTNGKMACKHLKTGSRIMISKD